MKMTYDPKVDALAIDLADAPTETMRELSPGVNGDFDADGRLTSIEILNASLRYPVREMKQLGDGVVWLTLIQAAKEAKLTAKTLRNQLNAGRLKGKKVGRDWQVSRTVLWNYLESRAPSGAPPAHGKRVTPKGRI